MEAGKKFIELKKVFQTKNPRLSRLMPGMVMNYLRNVIHENEVNAFIAQHGEKKTFEFAIAVLEMLNVKVKTKGIENIPATGGFIMACNHPLGGLDAMVLMEVMSNKRRDIKFIVNDILLQLKNLEGVFIGTNKHGKNAYEKLRVIDALFGTDAGILIFPAGLVSRKQNNTIKDLDWQKSFITRAKKYQRNVIPCLIGGTNSNRFYNLANWRKRFGIKANIEMFFLVDEMFKKRNNTIEVTIGKPISFLVFDKSKTDLQWADWVKTQVYGLN